MTETGFGSCDQSFLVHWKREIFKILKQLFMQHKCIEDRWIFSCYLWARCKKIMNLSNKFQTKRMDGTKYTSLPSGDLFQLCIHNGLGFRNSQCNRYTISIFEISRRSVVWHEWSEIVRQFLLLKYSFAIKIVFSLNSFFFVRKLCLSMNTSVIDQLLVQKRFYNISMNEATQLEIIQLEIYLNMNANEIKFMWN